MYRGDDFMKKLLLSAVIVAFLSVNSYALRIISLSPSTTEILFKLGLGSDIVGDTLFSNYPEAAKKITKVGSYVRPNLEKILRLRPDYVIGMQEGMNRSVRDKLEELGIKSRFYSSKNVSDIIFMIRDLARLFNKNPNPMVKRIEKYYKKFPPIRKTGVFVVSVQPLIVATLSTFVNSIMRCAGIKNIITDKSLEFVMIDKEFIIKKQPDYIIVSLGVKKQIDKAKSFIKRFHLKSRLLIVDPNIYNRPSYRIVNACLDLRKRTSY